MSFQSLLNKYRKEAFSERDKGEKFERLMQAYLKTDPKYAYRFKHVWLWNEFHAKADLGGLDTGIDLVALTHEGDYWAIQCKCYQETTTIDKKAVDSFLSTSSREFLNHEMQTVRFSNRLWISTTNKWGANASEAFRNQNPPVNRINLFDLQESPVNWEELDKGITGEQARTKKKELRQHQTIALQRTHDHFKSSDRGKLIMACGTGKTFTSLRIAEHETQGKGFVLFMVPSIALLGQTLREWTADAKEPINAICICSDSAISRKQNKNDDTDSFSVIDLALPASTDVKNIIKQFKHIHHNGNKEGMTVVFSTYQSIDVIAEAQKELLKGNHGFDIFDLVICDEAHRTTGVSLTEEDSSAFIKVHRNENIQARKRLYMTATPRLFSDDAKGKAAQADAILCSMDDPEVYGEEIYRIGFGDAVAQDLLTDYKVLILTLNENDIPPSVQSIITNKEKEINTDDASKLIGCINALSKQILGDAGIIKDSDPDPMRRAVAFCQNIKVSEKITETFNETTGAYIASLPTDKQANTLKVDSRHIDGSMNAPTRDELLGWLKEGPANEKECRVLTNVRCLSEGVDVPSLDAVMFLSARNSQVDVVQSVGRVMRKSPGKKYGYIIIPVVVPANVEADKALDDNDRYKVVWTVLNALRAHDDRFNATVNKIELNKSRPKQILVGRPEVTFENGEAVLSIGNGDGKTSNEIAHQLAIQFQELQNVMFARMVQKVGDRRYWEQWAKDVAQIAERFIERINRLVKEDGPHSIAFANFLEGLRKNINPSISEGEAIEMLSQHIITKPVFEALFEGYSFVKNNPISVSMQTMLDLLEAQAIEKDTETLQKFYESVKARAAGIDNAEGKQKIIVELYDKFFKTAFPRMVEKLGIVYTPVEVVDFIIHSVNDILQKEFGRTLSDENIQILDPFTGTGTFITRLLQSGLIKLEDLERKYTQELFANEIVLLAYYIAAINIENAFHDQTPDPNDGIGKEKYIPFEGICLTDTFQLGESDGSDKLFSEMFPQNSERVQRQKKAPLRVIMGNPPYSVGQKSANDNAQNQSYEKLDKRIEATYAKGSNATSIKALYDSYIKAFRWSSDRLDPKNGGIIAFVSNGAWLDGNGMDGFRKSLENEFSSIYAFNLRGNARTSGELRQKEAGNVFGSGSRTPITITLLVKKPGQQNQKAKIHYRDIGDYLSRDEKLNIIHRMGSIANSQLNLVELSPNEHGDWLNHRNDIFGTYIPVEPEKKFDSEAKSFVVVNSLGVNSNRDAWVYNSSKASLINRMEQMVAFYNEQVKCFIQIQQKQPNIQAETFKDANPCKISWSSSLVSYLERGQIAKFDPSKIEIGLYRPFFKQFIYFGEKMIHRPGQIKTLLPNEISDNLIICGSGVGVTKEFSTIITNVVPDMELVGKNQCFPLYYYEERKKEQRSLFDTDDESDYIRRDGISDFILERARAAYGNLVKKEDIFYYVYGILHSPHYKETFASDLKKMLPRIPLVDDARDFWKFSKAGRQLAELHLNYEKVPPYNEVTVHGAELLSFIDTDTQDTTKYLVDKMRFPKKDQKDTIIYNSRITIENIPAEAYEYIVNGKSAIEWIMERYQITTHKESGIRNNPNDWATEHNQPRYILDLLLSIINVSVQTVAIVKELPVLKFE